MMLYCLFKKSKNKIGLLLNHIDANRNEESLILILASFCNFTQPSCLVSKDIF